MLFANRVSAQKRGASDEGEKNFNCGDLGSDGFWGKYSAAGAELVEKDARGDGGGWGKGCCRAG